MQGKPGWNGFNHGLGDETMKDVDEDVEFTILKRVDVPPASLKCEHQKEGNNNCRCEQAALPDGYNVRIEFDKNDLDDKTNNRTVVFCFLVTLMAMSFKMAALIAVWQRFAHAGSKE